MNIKVAKIDELKPYENNPRENERAVEGVARSLAEFGYINPIIVNADNVILAGHTRLKAAQRLGLDEVEVLVVDHLTEEQERAYRLADNKTQEASTWSLARLAAELKDITKIDMSLFGFNAKDYAAEDPGEIEEDTPPSINDAPARVSPGDLWQLGDHFLRCGDSTDPERVQHLTGGEPIDLVVTDPPYNVNIGNRRGVNILNDNMEDKAFIEFLTKAFINMREALKPGGVFYIWYAILKHPEFKQALLNAGLDISQVLIWNKNNVTLGWSDYRWKHEGCLYGWTQGAKHYFISDRGQPSVIKLPQLEPENMKKSELVAYIKELQEQILADVLDEGNKKTPYKHPSQKPVNLMARLIVNSSQRGGERAGPFRRHRSDPHPVRTFGPPLFYAGVRSALVRPDHRALGNVNRQKAGKGKAIK